MNILSDLSNHCRDLLKTLPQALSVSEYLNSRLSPNAQEKFCFGYFPETKNIQILSSSIDENLLIDNNIIMKKNVQDNLLKKEIKYGFFEDHNLIMPYKDVYGKIISIVGRTILSEEDRKNLDIVKYKNTSFKKGNHLFGLYESKNAILKNNLVYVVEGQFDCISAHDKGMENVVALGSSNMTFSQFALLNRYTNNIILLLDNDDAGRAGSEKIIGHYGKYANVKKCFLPDGFKDLDEYLKDNSVKQLRF